jgi:hypothetical protein
MPCRCFNTLAYYLENAHEEFDQFLHEKAFGLYFQSPWVSRSTSLRSFRPLSTTVCDSSATGYMFLHSVMPSTPYDAARLSSLYPSSKNCARPSRTFYSPTAFPKETPKHPSSATKAAESTSTPTLRPQVRQPGHDPAHTAKATAGFGSQPRTRKSKILASSTERSHYSITPRREATFWTRTCGLEYTI